MRRLVLAFLLLLLPNLALASCGSSGATVVYINGIFTTLSEARSDLSELKDLYQNKTQDYSVKFINGYNPSHFEGVGDLIQSAFQSFFSSASDLDRDTILMQIHPEVTTRKLLLVGHSQGSFYSNSIYNYLLDHGEPRAAVGVYNVASPASYTAGGGMYLTANQDTIIAWVADMTKASGGLQPLAPNTDLPLTIEQSLDAHPGHSFAGYYLQNAGSRIASDLQFELNQRKAELSSDTGECFTPPDNNLGYKSKQVFFAVGDPLATGAVTGTKIVAQAAVVAKDAAVAAVGAAGSALNALNPFAKIEPRTANVPGSFTVVKALYGSSADEAQLRELLGTSQGGAVALAASNQEEVKGAQTVKPQDSLVPFPNGTALTSPGFGGGSGTAQSIVEETSVAAATSTATSTPPAPAPAVPDGVPPSVATVTINGAALPQLSPFATTPAATTTTTWSSIVTFDEDIGVAPTVKDGTASFDFTNGTEQAVGDCGDGDAKTFCFTYVPPPNIEAAIYWFFRVAGAQDSSGEVMATTTYRFIVDTAGPVLSLDTSATSQILPTVSGTSSFTSATIVLLLNAIQYSFGSPNGLWSFAVQAGNELAEGIYPIIATSTDQYNNQVVYNWMLAVDLTLPVLSITSGPAEGDSVASTSPVSFGFSATDATAVSYACAVDSGGSSTCTSPYSFSPAPGAHSFAVTATDAAGNATSTARNFIVLP